MRSVSVFSAEYAGLENLKKKFIYVISIAPLSWMCSFII